MTVTPLSGTDLVDLGAAESSTKSTASTPGFGRLLQSLLLEGQTGAGTSVLSDTADATSSSESADSKSGGSEVAGPESESAASLAALPVPIPLVGPPSTLALLLSAPQSQQSTGTDAPTADEELAADSADLPSNKTSSEVGGKGLVAMGAATVAAAALSALPAGGPDPGVVADVDRATLHPTKTDTPAGTESARLGLPAMALPEQAATIAQSAEGTAGLAQRAAGTAAMVPTGPSLNAKSSNETTSNEASSPDALSSRALSSLTLSPSTLSTSAGSTSAGSTSTGSTSTGSTSAGSGDTNDGGPVGSPIPARMDQNGASSELSGQTAVPSLATTQQDGVTRSTTADGLFTGVLNANQQSAGEPVAGAAPAAPTGASVAALAATVQTAGAASIASPSPTTPIAPSAVPAVITQQAQDLQRSSTAQHRTVIRLDPPELGALTLQVTALGDDVAIIARTETAEAARALMRQRGDMALAIESLGMSLSGFDVQTGSGSQLPERQRTNQPGQRDRSPSGSEDVFEHPESPDSEGDIFL